MSPFGLLGRGSGVGIDAVLVQKSSTGTEEVLAFASRNNYRNYSATELECLAVMWALEKWRHYLEGHLFSVVTDHAALLWVFKTIHKRAGVHLYSGIQERKIQLRA